MVRLERRVLDTVPAGGDAMRMNRGLARGRCWVGVRSVQLLQPPVHTVCRGCLSMHAHAVHGDTDTVSVAMTTSCVSLQLVIVFSSSLPPLVCVRSSSVSVVSPLSTCPGSSGGATL